MAENYDLIFGQGASSQYAWSDSDYQNGWKTVGSTPPTAEQFDALQRRSDTKAKDLNNRLSPLETTASKALARVTPAANRLPYFNSSNSATTTAISDFIKTLLDDGNAATARATLGAPSTTGANASGSWNINAATATKLATPRKINITGNATGAATFDGSGDVSISTTVNESKHADSANKLFWGDGNTCIQSGAGDYSPTVGGDSANMNIASWYGVSFTSSSNSGVIPKGKTAVGIDVRDSVVRAMTFEGTLNGNAASATNADKLDGYHLSDIYRQLGGHNTPTITSIIDWNTMKACNGGTDVRNINNTTYGVRAYGGDNDFSSGVLNGYAKGSFYLTQDYTNFDKLCFLFCSNAGKDIEYTMTDVFLLNYIMTNYSVVNLSHDNDDFWIATGYSNKGTAKDKVSTKRIFSAPASMEARQCGIVDVLGIKY